MKTATSSKKVYRSLEEIKEAFFQPPRNDKEGKGDSRTQDHVLEKQAVEKLKNLFSVPTKPDN